MEFILSLPEFKFCSQSTGALIPESSAWFWLLNGFEKEMVPLKKFLMIQFHKRSKRITMISFENDVKKIFFVMLFFPARILLGNIQVFRNALLFWQLQDPSLETLL